MAYRRKRGRSGYSGRRSGYSVGRRPSGSNVRRRVRQGGYRSGGGSRVQTVRIVMQPAPAMQQMPAFPGMTLPAVTPTGMVNASAPNPRRAKF